MHAPHAVRWFPEDLTLAAAERKYVPRIDGTSPARVHVLLIGGRACGFIQNYHVRDHPGGSDIDAVGIDYAIGAAALTGGGLGPQMIWSYLRQVVFPRWPGVPFVAACPEVANHRSIRALVKAGFVPAGEIAARAPAGPEMLCTLDRQRIFGPPANAGDS